MQRSMLAALLAVTLAGCGTEPEAAPAGTVATSGKVDTPLAQVPEAVLAAARAAQPTMAFTEASAEMRDGRSYYDIEGTLPDGAPIELDLLGENGAWSVVETQRDVAFAAAPEQVRSAFARADTGFEPVRVIESRQDDGLIIYELFGPTAGGSEGPKVEVKYDGRTAELLTREWAH